MNEQVFLFILSFYLNAFSGDWSRNLAPIRPNKQLCADTQRMMFHNVWTQPHTEQVLIKLWEAFRWSLSWTRTTLLVLRHRNSVNLCRVLFNFLTLPMKTFLRTWTSFAPEHNVVFVQRWWPLTASERKIWIHMNLFTLAIAWFESLSMMVKFDHYSFHYWLVMIHLKGRFASITCSAATKIWSGANEI